MSSQEIRDAADWFLSVLLEGFGAWPVRVPIACRLRSATRRFAEAQGLTQLAVRLARGRNLIAHTTAADV